MSSEEESYPRRKPIKIKPANKHVSSTRKYKKKIQGLCLLSLSYDTLFLFVALPT